MSRRVIEAHNLGKRYRLGQNQRYETIREAIAGSVRHRLWRRESSRIGTQELWALRHVEFVVDAGESVGVIGRNGAGKSTVFEVLELVRDFAARGDRCEGRLVGRTRTRWQEVEQQRFELEVTGNGSVYKYELLIDPQPSRVVRNVEAGVYRPNLDRVYGLADVASFPLKPG